MTDLDTATKECLTRVAKAFVHRWLGDDHAVTDSGLEMAIKELYEHLKMAYILGRVDQDTARIEESTRNRPGL